MKSKKPGKGMGDEFHFYRLGFKERCGVKKVKKDTGWKALLRESNFNFLKWGEYMKRANIAERKVEKLKRLILLTDDSVSDVSMNDLTARQWSEFVRVFPEERPQ